MITWLQNATGKHHRLIFGFLLVVIVVSFVFYGFAGRGALTGGPAYMYQGVNLNDPAVRKRHNDAVFFGQMTGQRMDPNGLVQRVAELTLADSLGIPAPSAIEIRRLAREMTAAADTKSNDGLNKFLEFAGKQLDASDLDVRARFETYIKDSWRIQKALGALAGSGHATASQIKRILDRERTKWTVDVGTFSAAGFKPDVKVDEAKVKEAFTANIEDYRLPARVAVTAVTIAPTAADTAPVTDDEIINMGYNQAEKFKFETGKVKEQALAKRAELEKLVRAERAVTNLAGQISDELAEKFPVDTAKADSKELAAWIKAKNAKVTSLPAFDVNAAPTVAQVPAEALRVAGELTEKEWRTEVYRSEAGATFILLNQRTPDRLPTFDEAKTKAVEAWKKSQFNRLLAEEANKLAKGIQADLAAGKTFTDSAKARKLALTSPEAFSVYAVPEALNGANENTGLLIEAAGVGKVTSPIRTANGDYVFIRPAKKDLPADKSGAEESRLFAQRISQRNAYFTGSGLVQDIVPPPVEAK
jgi:peptidyl-prolyl cis-trans isomerase D